MGSEIARVEHADVTEVFAPGQAPVLAGGLGPAEARIGIGGPLDGKVIRSASTRLDYRKPSVTVVADLDTGQVMDASAEAPTLMTYVPKTIQVLGVRQYRIWVSETWWMRRCTEARVAEEFEAEVLLRLIDADPREVRLCRQLP